MSDGWFVQGPLEDTQITVELRCPLPHPDCSAALIFSFLKCGLSSSEHLRKIKIPDMCICYWYSTGDGFSWSFLCCFLEEFATQHGNIQPCISLSTNIRLIYLMREKIQKNILFLRCRQNGKDWIKKGISISRSAATFWPSLICYSKKELFCRLMALGHK